MRCGDLRHSVWADKCNSIPDGLLMQIDNRCLSRRMINGDNLLTACDNRNGRTIIGSFFRALLLTLQDYTISNQ